MGSTKYPLIAPPGGDKPALPVPGQPAPMREDEFAPGSVANRITFGFDSVSPPSALYIQRDDKINLFMDTNVPAGDTVVFALRFLRVPEPQGGQPDVGGVGRHPGAIYTRGIVQQETETMVIGSVGGLNRQINLAEGYLLSVGAVATNALVRGRTYVRATLIRTVSTPFVTSQQLFADYVTNLTAAGYPGGRMLHSTEGPGWRRSIQVATPAAGADWTFTAGLAQRVSVVSLSAIFTAAAAVASRQANLIVDDGANTLWQDDLTSNITAGQTAIVSAAQVQPTVGVIATTLFFVLPPGLVLPPGFRLRTSTGGIQAADQWSAIWLNVEEWLDAI